MVRSSLVHSPAKLNLSHRKTMWLQNAVMIGNRMAEALNRLEISESLPNDDVVLMKQWNELMVELVEMLL